MISTARRLLRDTVLATGLGAARDVRVVVRAVGKRPAPAGAGHVVIAAPGGGNIGDQAMLEAYLAHAEGPVTVVVSAVDSLRIPDAETHRVTVVSLPALLYQSRGAHRAALEELGALIARASSVSVIGADIMDGAYVPRASVSRAMIVRAAARAGRDARVLGFSWPAHPRLAARRQLALAARAGGVLLARDPVSLARLRSDGIGTVRQVSDLVFSTPEADPALFDELAITGPYAVVNISGHLGRSVDLVPDYVALLAELRRRGLTVVLLPHVVTASADDRVPTARLRALAGDDGVIVVERVPSPAEVRGLTAGASVTVTGRMHLAIMTLLHGIPAITLASQGKVEGLMTMFSAPELCIEPSPGAGERIIALLDEVLPSDASVRTRIAAALPAVRALSLGNFPAGSEVARADAGSRRPTVAAPDGADV